jgi:flavin-dependent dehydrogenase
MPAMAADADVVVVGAGPSGVATALLLARRGHRVVVVDRARFPRDKACGEGLMPPGVGVLARLGLLEAVRATGARELRSVSYRMLDAGPVATAAFPSPGHAPEPVAAHGLGVRRLRMDAVLVDALRREPGVELRERMPVTALVRDGQGRVSGVGGEGWSVSARVVIGADGLHSRVRAAAGWTPAPRCGGARYGLAGHWRLDTAAMEGISVWFAGDHEWYQAPVGRDELLVSVLGSRERIGAIARDYADAVRASVPRLRDAELMGPVLAAGQLAQRPRRVAGGGLFLVGDAAGHDDPITGDGIATGLLGAELLAGRVDALLRERVPPAAAAAGYARDHERLWRDRRRVTGIALFMARHPGAARRAIAATHRRRHPMEVLLGVNCGYWGLGHLTPRDWLSLAGI